MSVETPTSFETAAPPPSGFASILRAFVGILDNPIFVKHKRTRLRRAQTLPAAVVVFVLCLCIAYGGYQMNGFANGGAFGFLSMLQVIILSMIGGTQIASSVGGARESGIIDYHRVSPMTPLALALGFFFGAPVREYLLFALTIPLALICVWYEAPEFSGFLQTMVAMFVGAWTLHAFALLTSLTAKKPKAGGRGMIALFVFFFIFGGNVGGFMLSRATARLNADATLGFFGYELPWLAMTLIYSLPLLGYVMLAAVRKMRSEKAHAFTKPEAVSAVAVFATLLIGGVWGSTYSDVVVLVVVYAMVVLCSVLVMTVTPNYGEFVKGIRRAEKEGGKTPGPFSDLALNRASVVVFALITLIAASFVAQSSAGIPINRGGFGRPEYSFSVTITTAVFIVAYVGFAYQAFLLIAPKRGGTVFALFMFLAWLVPVMVGTIVGVGGGNETAAKFILALSPAVGLGLSAGVSGDDGARLYQAAALLPAIFFAFGFNNLVVIFRRRAIASVRAATMKPKDAKSVDLLS